MTQQIRLEDWQNSDQGIAIEGGLSGLGGQYVRVNDAESGLEFTDEIVAPLVETAQLNADLIVTNDGEWVMRSNGDDKVQVTSEGISLGDGLGSFGSDGKIKDTGYTGAARLGNRNDEDFVYDDLNAPDGTLLFGRTSPTGQAWDVQGPGAATVSIENGAMTSASNVYPSLPLSSLTRASGVVSFELGAGANNNLTVLTLIMQEGTGLSKMLHLIIGPVSCTLQLVAPGHDFEELFSHTYPSTLIYGAQYGVAMESTGSDYTVYCPDGAKVTGSAVGIDTIAFDHATWQILPDADKRIGHWHTPGIGGSIARAVSGNGLAAPMQDLYQTKIDLIGSGFSQKQTITATLPSGAGFYRIANEMAVGTNIIAGTVRVSLFDPLTGYNAGGLFAVQAVSANNAPTITQLSGYGFITPLVSLRLSNQTGSPFAVALDVETGSANPLTAVFTFEGYFATVAAPVVGATPYATSYVLPFNEGGALVAPALGISGTSNLQALNASSGVQLGDMGGGNYVLKALPGISTLALFGTSGAIQQSIMETSADAAITELQNIIIAFGFATDDR